MPILKPKCPKCGKIADLKSEYHLGKNIVKLFQCGHFVTNDAIATNSNYDAVVSTDGKSLYEYQKQTIKFIEDSQGRALVAHEMGLGKTIIVQGFLTLHPEENPTLYCVKSSLKIQFAHEIMRWQGTGDDDGDYPYLINNARSPIPPGQKSYVVSYDLIPRFENCPKCNHEAHKPGACFHRSRRGKTLDCDCMTNSQDRPDWFREQLKKCGIRTVVLDECHLIKNLDSERTKSIRRAVYDIPNIIGLSGTPIKNNASEFFTILNLLLPNTFNNYSRFVSYDCESYLGKYGGRKVGGIRDIADFKRKTDKNVIRFTREEVLPDLPAVTRNFLFSELGDAVQDAYVQTVNEFVDEYNSNGKSGAIRESSLMAYMSKMRHLTGYSKVDPCVDTVDEFLTSSDRKLVIFLHHKDVGEMLKIKLDKLMKDSMGINEPLVFTSDLTPEQRNNVVNKFMNEDYRVLIASTLAAGEGLNLQKCSDCIIMERQWNPGNEEQAEGRFIRIGQIADKVTAHYLIAVGTIDEFFSELVERKRAIFAKTVDGKESKWDESSLIKELQEILAAKGAAQWAAVKK